MTHDQRRLLAIVKANAPLASAVLDWLSDMRTVFEQRLVTSQTWEQFLIQKAKIKACEELQEIIRKCSGGDQ